MNTSIRGIVAIDGPAGSGKSSAGHDLAQRLPGYVHVSSGWIYRCIADMAIDKRLDPAAAENLGRAVDSLTIEVMRDPDGGPSKVFVNGRNLTVRIGEDEVAQMTALIAIHRQVRDAANRILHVIAGEGGVVCDGRDIGTSVFPYAHAKIFLTASLDERARRTNKRPELLADRDRKDSERELSPLRKAADAYPLDNTGLSKAETVNILYEYVITRLPR